MRQPSSSNFVYLFAALVVLTLVGPLLAATLGELGHWIGDLTLFVSLVIALGSVATTPIQRLVAVALVLASVAALSGWVIWRSPSALLSYRLIGIAFLLLSIVVAGVSVLRADRVDLNRLVGGLCVYLLIGAVFALLFAVLESLLPASFAGLGDSASGPALWRFQYFSFVTLSTLGYGDIVPGNAYAQALVVVEALLGQFYLAVLIAGLVGAYLNDRVARRPPAPDGRAP